MAPARATCLLIVGAVLLAGGGGRGDGPARVRIGGRVWKVELAADPDSRQRGLSGRKHIPEDTGMLFVFPAEEVVHFHMRACHVPLDAAFISSGLRVAWVRTMRVEADPDRPEAIYSSRHPVRYVLEVPAGALGRAGVAVGDRVELLGVARNASKDAR